jgi:hypothetical protein
VYVFMRMPLLIMIMVSVDLVVHDINHFHKLFKTFFYLEFFNLKKSSTKLTYHNFFTGFTVTKHPLVMLLNVNFHYGPIMKGLSLGGPT